MALYTHIKGPAKYTVVGSPTIVDGVASGFSLTDGLAINSTFTPTSIEWNIKFRTGDAFGEVDNQELIAFLQNHSTARLRILLLGKRVPCIVFKGTNYTLNDPAGVVVTTDTDYIMHGKINANGITAELLDVSGNVLCSKTVTDSIDMSVLSNILYTRLGALLFGNSSFLTGTIDLNHTYITVNGLPWFGSCPVRVKFRTGLAKYNVVGNPTIENGIVSGFTSSAYTVLNKKLDYSKEVQLVFRMKILPSVYEDGEMIVTDGTTDGGHYGLGIYRNGYERLAFIMADTEHDKWNEGASFNGVTQDVFWYFKMLITNTNFKIFMGSSMDNLTLKATAERSGKTEPVTPLYFGSRGHLFGLTPKNIALDLNKTYIKVNGEYFFRGAYNADTYTLRIK